MTSARYAETEISLILSKQSNHERNVCSRFLIQMSFDANPQNFISFHRSTAKAASEAAKKQRNKKAILYEFMKNLTVLASLFSIKLNQHCEKAYTLTVSKHHNCSRPGCGTIERTTIAAFAVHSRE